MSGGAHFGKGLGANIAARLLWGAGAWYFALAHTTDDGLLFFHRLLWAVAFCALMMAASGALPSLRAVLRDRSKLPSLLCSSLLIASNWYVVIWCIVHGKVLCASLGFYLAPIGTVMLGHMLTKEGFDRVTRMALLLCAAGVGLIMLSSTGTIEWQGLYIAASSVAYVFVRKRTPVPALAANFLESAIPLAFLLPWMAWRLWDAGEGIDFWPAGNTPLYFVGIGVATTVPMILYVYSLDKIPLALVGYLQYLSPSIMFLLGITVLHESITPTRTVGFMLVWTSIALHVLRSRLVLSIRSYARK